MLTDPIGDMLTRIRNAAAANLGELHMPHSRLKNEIAKVLEREGYVEGVRVDTIEGRPELVMKLRYAGRRSVIRGLKRESRPGGRKYLGHSEIYAVANGFGTLVLSTPKGVMTGAEAKQQHVGGEALLSVW